MKETKQLENWESNLGKEYLERNNLSPEEADHLCVEYYGVSRTELNKEFLGGINAERFLEVGCNIGNQLVLLQKMGYSDLWGIEPYGVAIEMAKKKTCGINLVQAAAFDIPFKNGFFDVVFTAGVLIHISPKDIDKAIDEMYRCSGRYILGLEYYAKEGYEEINYHGQGNLLWKTDFSKLFTDRFSDLKLVKKRILDYKNNSNADIMYLLEKTA